MNSWSRMSRKAISLFELSACRRGVIRMRRSSANGNVSSSSAGLMGSATMPDVAEPLGDGADDLSALALLDDDVDVRMSGEEHGQSRRQKFDRCNRVRKHVYMASQPFGKIVQLAAHLLQVLYDDPRVTLKRRSRWSKVNAPPLPLKEWNAEGALHGGDPLARRRQGHVRSTRPMRDALGLRDMEKQPQIGQIEPNRHLWMAAVSLRRRLRHT